jgi:predicted negative regulator of RcsB-dependent stress response
MAEGNLRMGEILLATGTKDAAVSRFAKAREIYLGERFAL